MTGSTLRQLRRQLRQAGQQTGQARQTDRTAQASTLRPDIPTVPTGRQLTQQISAQLSRWIDCSSAGRDDMMQTDGRILAILPVSGHFGLSMPRYRCKLLSRAELNRVESCRVDGSSADSSRFEQQKHWSGSGPVSDHVANSTIFR